MFANLGKFGSGATSAGLFGFASGGYTGDIGAGEIAGIVRGGE
jgi:hypothetical protein